MSLEQVITSGEAFKEPSFTFFLVLVVSLFFFGFGMMTLANQKDKPILSRTSISAFLSFILVAVVIITFIVKQNDYNNQFAEWRDEQAYPYIKTLPSETKEVISIRESGHLIGGAPLHTIEYLEAGLTKYYKGVIELVYDLEQGAAPSADFYYTETDFGHDLDKDLYVFEVHLPVEDK